MTIESDDADMGGSEAVDELVHVLLVGAADIDLVLQFADAQPPGRFPAGEGVADGGCGAGEMKLNVGERFGVATSDWGSVMAGGELVDRADPLEDAFV